MGLAKTSKLKDAALVTSTKKGGSFVKDKESEAELLRPNWQTNFADNSCWHSWIIKFMRQKISVQNPMLTVALMTAKSNTEILDRVEVVFKNIAAEFRKKSKAPTAKSEVGSTTLIRLDDEEQRATDNRHKGRKVRVRIHLLVVNQGNIGTQKSDEREEAIELYHFEVPTRFDYFFQWQYQSTDESDVSDVLDPDTDVEESAEVPVKSTRKPWKSRAPMYRGDEASLLLDAVYPLLIYFSFRTWCKRSRLW
jgi:hypothetical protein